MTGYRSVQSYPFLVNNRMPTPLRRTIILKPSCLISWIQLVPFGGLSARLGRQGATRPTAAQGIDGRADMHVHNVVHRASPTTPPSGLFLDGGNLAVDTFTEAR